MSEDNYRGFPVVVDDRLPSGFIGLFAPQRHHSESQDHLQGVRTLLCSGSRCEPLRVWASYVGTERSVPGVVSDGQ